MYTLRDYQKDIVASVRKEWESHRSVMVQMPTGTGKTHVLASIVNEECRMKREKSSSTILIVAHRVELVEQIRETVFKFKVENEELIIISIQKVSKRIASFDFSPHIVIIDEAHHALARTYRVLWEKWPEARFLGLTATPCRMNRMGFTDLFDTMVMSWSIAEFIRKGVLSAFDYVSIRPESEEQRLIDSLQKRGTDGDYQVKEMDAVLNRHPSIGRLYQSLMKFAPGMKGIVYAISIDHARRIAEYYNEQGIKTVAIDSETPREVRKQWVEAFKAGTIQVMVNVDVFCEGFDCPNVEFIQLARPTLSLAKYLQQIGRGLRKTEGKETCMMIDNVGLYRVFGLPVVERDWIRMFRGEVSGKGQRPVCFRNETMGQMTITAKLPEQDTGVEWVVSHGALLEQLQERKVEYRYVKIFDSLPDMTAVRFGNHDCGLVDRDGQVVWRRKGCRCLKFSKNHFLKIEKESGDVEYMDLYNLQTYGTEPEVKRYGTFELLKVGHRCYSRTLKRYVSDMDYESLYITYKGNMLSICEPEGKRFCLLEGDEENYYCIRRRLPDRSLLFSDAEGNFYHIRRGEEKKAIDSVRAERLEEEIRKSMETEKIGDRRRIQAEYRDAIPYQAGTKWGLKVGNRITIPPVYRLVREPVGIYCAVEKDYQQWGIINIDGTVLVAPQYIDVSIDPNGTALLTKVTGKKVSVKLK